MIYLVYYFIVIIINAIGFYDGQQDAYVLLMNIVTAYMSLRIEA